VTQITRSLSATLIRWPESRFYRMIRLVLIHNVFTRVLSHFCKVGILEFKRKRKFLKCRILFGLTLTRACQPWPEITQKFSWLLSDSPRWCLNSDSNRKYFGSFAFEYFMTRLETRPHNKKNNFCCVVTYIERTALLTRLPFQSQRKRWRFWHVIIVPGPSIYFAKNYLHRKVET